MKDSARMMVALTTGAALALTVSGCAAPPTRAEDPARYVLVARGEVPAASAPVLVDCLTEEFTRLNKGNTAFSVKQTRRADGLRVEVYVSNVNLAVSADVFNDGRAELRVAPDPFDMFKKEPAVFRECASKLGTVS